VGSQRPPRDKCGGALAHAALLVPPPMTTKRQNVLEKTSSEVATSYLLQMTYGHFMQNYFSYCTTKKCSLHCKVCDVDTYLLVGLIMYAKHTEPRSILYQKNQKTCCEMNFTTSYKRHETFSILQGWPILLYV